MRKEGTCALTGRHGRFVKAHIIPRALTYKGSDELPFAQAGSGSPPIKRWDSWYDPNLVVAEGEEIFERLDQWGVSELRRLHLVWSGWGPATDIPAEHQPIPGTQGWGVRKVETRSGKLLRLFFLSILWRAAASSMREFKEVDLRASDLRRLRRMLLDEDHQPLSFFPFSLTQLSTKGGVHNMAPIASSKPASFFEKNGPRIPIFRFYFDGLIAHFHRKSSAEEVERIGPMLVGSSDTIAVSTVTFEESWQAGNLRELIREAEEVWPDRLARIPGFKQPTT